jgi:hypothetical protein
MNDTALIAELCPFCNGTGKHELCHGEGCFWCNGTGDCELCHGSGEIDMPLFDEDGS